MPTILRCLTAMALFAVAAQAQSNPAASSDSWKDLGFPGVVLYLASRDLIPMAFRKIKGNGNGSSTSAAVTANSLENLEQRFDAHVSEDRDNFSELRETMAEVREGLARIEGYLNRSQRQ